MLQLPTAKRPSRAGVKSCGPLKGVPLASPGTCDVLALALQYEKAVRQYEKVNDDVDDRLWRQMQKIAERASWMTPRSLDGALFQIMLVSVALDGIRTGSTAEYRKECEARANRLLYRVMEKFSDYASEWNELKEWLMPARCDQKKPSRTRKRG